MLPVWVSCPVIYRSPLNENIALRPFISARPCFVKMKLERSAALEEIAAIRRGWGGKGSAGQRFNCLLDGNAKKRGELY